VAAAFGEIHRQQAQQQAADAAAKAKAASPEEVEQAAVATLRRALGENR